MTTHDRDKVIAAAEECFDCYEDGRGRFEYSADEYGLERFYALAFEAGRVDEREECERLATINRADLTAEAIRARGEKEMTKPAECINGCPENQVCDHCQNNWIDLPTLQDVAKAQADGWEIKFKTIYEGWATWEQATWNGGITYRGRPRKPKMKEVKMECLLIDGELHWRSEYMSVLQSWIRQPHLDLIVKVPE